MTSFKSDLVESFVAQIQHSSLNQTVFLIVFATGSLYIASLLASYARVLLDVSLPHPNVMDQYGAVRNPNGNAQRSWAIVTGPTAGIGEEFAKQLAKAGLNLGLVGRNPTKLAEIEKQLVKYNIKVSSFVLDAESATSTDYEHLRTWATNLDGGVSVLINNMGVSHAIPVPFAETEDSELRRIINVNTLSTLEVTRAVLPLLQTTGKTKGRRALILTMGSFAGLMPTPLLAVYSGSKAFLQGWSSALAAELEPENVDVQLVLSYLVTSKMSKVRKSSLAVPNCKTFVASALRSIGRRGGARERAWTSTPYWAHALLHWFVAAGPGVFNPSVARLNLGMHVDIRRRALKKAARD